MKQKKVCTYVFAILYTVITGVTTLHAQWIWIQKSSLPVFIEAPVSFIINNMAYVGTGNQAGIGFTNSFWQYNQTANTWTQIADFGGTPRINAIAASANGFGYVGFGYDNLNHYKSDLWLYNPTANSWFALASYPGAGQQAAVCFATSTTLYVVSGKNTGTYNNSMFQYNFSTNTWDPPLPVILPARWHAYSFYCGQAAYIGGGTNNTGALNDLWKYNLITGLWTQQTNCPISRSAAVAASANNSGLIGSGNDWANQPSDAFYEYHIQNNAWNILPSIPGPARKLATGFSFGNGIYVAAGTDANNTKLNDMWLLQPTTSLNDAYHNPCQVNLNSNNEWLNISCENLNANTCITVFNTNGSIAAEWQIVNTVQLNVSSLTPGIYLLRIKNDACSMTKKIFIP